MREEKSVSLIEEKASVGCLEGGGRTVERMVWETVGWGSSLIPKKVATSVSKTLTFKLWMSRSSMQNIFLVVLCGISWLFVISSDSINDEKGLKFGNSVVYI
jgi:hypothetical protein